MRISLLCFLAAVGCGMSSTADPRADRDADLPDPDAAIDPVPDAGTDAPPECSPGWRTAPTCDIELNLGYLPPWGEVEYDAQIDERVSAFCDVESCGCASDLESPRAEFDCFCAAAEACQPAHLRTAAGAAVGPCWTDYLVIPTADGCVFETSQGCELSGPPTVRRFRAIDCSAEARDAFDSFASPLRDEMYENRFWADPAVIEEGTATLLRWDIDPAAAYCRVVDHEGPEVWFDGGILVTPSESRDYVLDCPGGPGAVVGMRTRVEVTEATAERSFEAERVLLDGLFIDILSWSVEDAEVCTLEQAGRDPLVVDPTSVLQLDHIFDGLLRCEGATGTILLQPLRAAES